MSTGEQGAGLWVVANVSTLNTYVHITRSHIYTRIYTHSHTYIHNTQSKSGLKNNGREEKRRREEKAYSKSPPFQLGQGLQFGGFRW